MMPMPVYATPASPEKYAEFLMRRASLIEDACTNGARLLADLLPARCHQDLWLFASSVKRVLTVEINAELEAIANPQVPNRPRVTIDMLAEAQKQVESIEAQIDKARASADNLPDALYDLWEASMLPALEGPLNQATAYRDSLQRALETQEPA